MIRNIFQIREESIWNDVRNTNISSVIITIQYTTLYISYFVLNNVFTNLYGMELCRTLVEYKMFACTVLRALVILMVDIHINACPETKPLHCTRNRTQHQQHRQIALVVTTSINPLTSPQKPYCFITFDNVKPYLTQSKFYFVC